MKIKLIIATVVHSLLDLKLVADGDFFSISTFHLSC